MISITLEPFTHNSKSCIAIKFPYNFEVKEYIKKFSGVHWTKTHRTFYIYYSEVRLEDIKTYIKQGGLHLLNENYKDTIPKISLPNRKFGLCLYLNGYNLNNYYRKDN